jgi:hypothetical protein
VVSRVCQQSQYVMRFSMIVYVFRVSNKTEKRTPLSCLCVRAKGGILITGICDFVRWSNGKCNHVCTVLHSRRYQLNVFYKPTKRSKPTVGYATIRQDAMFTSSLQLLPRPIQHDFSLIKHGVVKYNIAQSKTAYNLQRYQILLIGEGRRSFGSSNKKTTPWL